MATVSKLRQILHKKSPEYCASTPGAVVGSFLVYDKNNVIPTKDTIYNVSGALAVYNYNIAQDSWIQIPNTTTGGAFGGGSCGEFIPWSAPAGNPTISAAVGSTNITIKTSLTIVRNLTGCKVLVTGGTNAGYEGVVASNTVGPNAVLTLAVAANASFDSTTTFKIAGGSVWMFIGGIIAISFSVYDRITNTWTARSTTGVPVFITEGKLVSTNSYGTSGFVTGISTNTNTTTTLNDSTKTFLVNGFANYQVRIKSGTGAGQTRLIASNTATSLTVSAPWTITPDTTSNYVIEGNDDVFYLMGNSALLMYKYTISTNTWVQMTPSTPRAVAFSSGNTADWVDSVNDTLWNDGKYTSFYNDTLYRQNGRYFYAFRGANSSVLDVYDIAANKWINGISYGNQAETFNLGTNAAIYDGVIYIQKNNTGRIFSFDVAQHTMQPYTVLPVVQGDASNGCKFAFVTYYDGGDKIPYMYSMSHSKTDFTRWLMF